MSTPPPPPPPPPVQNTTANFDNKNMQAHIFRTEAEKTRNFIFGIAAIYLIGNIISIAVAGQITGILIAAVVLFPAIFTGLAFIAPKQPLIAIIISAVVVLIILIILIGVAASWSGWLFNIMAISCIVGGVMSANKAEQAKKLMH